MKSKDIAIVGILLAVGAIIRFLSLMIPGAITSNMVIAFYCLAIILVMPTVKEALGIGLISGMICALISHSMFPPGNLVSEPIGAIVCLVVYRMIKKVPLSVALTTFVATFASGLSFIAVTIAVMAPQILDKFATLSAYMLAAVPVVILCAAANAAIAQALYIPASRVIIRDKT